MKVSTALFLCALVVLAAALAVGFNFMGLFDSLQERRGLIYGVFVVVFFVLTITASNMSKNHEYTAGRRR